MYMSLPQPGAVAAEPRAASTIASCSVSGQLERLELGRRQLDERDAQVAQVVVVPLTRALARAVVAVRRFLGFTASARIESASEKHASTQESRPVRC